MRILIAEDEAGMQKILRLYLEKAGYQVEVAGDGEAAVQLACSRHFDLVLLDWMMPRLSGIEVCKQLRLYGSPAKILMLTARGESADELAGLSGGADDYVKKPFEPAILLLRIQKLLQTERLVTCGALSLNRQTHLVSRGGVPVELTRKEYDLLCALMCSQNQVVPRESLLTQVWGMDYDGDERTLDTHIRRLRGKIGEDYILTQVGLGYKMVEPHV